MYSQREREKKNQYVCLQCILYMIFRGMATSGALILSPASEIAAKQRILILEQVFLIHAYQKNGRHFLLCPPVSIIIRLCPPICGGLSKNYMKIGVGWGWGGWGRIMSNFFTQSCDFPPPPQIFEICHMLLEVPSNPKI